MTATAGRIKIKSVTKNNPCEVCGAVDGCGRGDDGFIFCRKRKGDVPGFVFMKEARADPQWSQYRKEGDPVLEERDRQNREEYRRTHQAKEPSTNGTDLDHQARELAGNMTGDLRTKLAKILDLPINVLDRIPLIGYNPSGFHQAQPCFTFPEVNANGRTIGIGCRYLNGEKKSKPGASRGLTIPSGWQAAGQDPVYLVEGSSDTLALCSIGLTAIGRPSNTGGVDLLTELLKDVPLGRRVIVIGEYDPKEDGKWPGKEGAERTASKLAEKLGRIMYWALPPDKAKDSRAWVNGLQLDPIHLDAWHDAGEAWDKSLKYQEVKPQKQTEPPRFEFIDSKTLSTRSLKREWVIKNIMAALQPGTIGGAFKVLKTSLMVDAALSIGSGNPFLGRFDIPRVMRVAVVSGESGEAILHDTAERVCKAKGIKLEDAKVSWCFDLPQLGEPSHLNQLIDRLKELEAEVLFYDPLYLGLLSAANGNSASNIFTMGPLLLGITQRCLAIGCTPFFVHHFVTNRESLKVPELSDLAFAGVKEFSRQWILVGRRERYEEGSGFHQLHLTIGGSAGQSGRWALDVNEGVVGDDFSGRNWEVALQTATEAKQTAKGQKEQENRQKKLEEQNQDDTAVMGIVDRLTARNETCSSNNIRFLSGLSPDRVQRAIARLKDQGILKEGTGTYRSGNGAEKTCPVFSRVKDEERY